MPLFTPAQDAYRFQADGTESGATLLGTFSTALPLTITGDHSNAFLRVRIQETGGKSGGATDAWQLQVQRNAFGFQNVTASSSIVKGFDSSNLTDDGNTTNRLGTGSGSFIAGKICEDGLVGLHQLTASNFTEHFYTLTLVFADLANGDALTFRVLFNGATITYNVTPQINLTVASTGQPAVKRAGGVPWMRHNRGVWAPER